MGWTSVSQGFLLLLVLRACRCEQSENTVDPNTSPFLANSAYVLEHGRIVSSPVNHPMPADQKQWPEMQNDGTNGNKRTFIARGDILIPIEEHESKRAKRKIIAEKDVYGESNRWPGGIIPYQFLSGIDDEVRRTTLSAMQHWQQLTCLRFEPYDPQRHSNFNCKVLIEDTGLGCSTYVGYHPATSSYMSTYSVYLPPHCVTGSAIHELGHVIGFYHEMSRTDRDQEINVYFDMMSVSDAAQYDVMPNPMPGYYGQPYDLGSIMHYYPTSVMTAKDSRRAFLMGQRTSLSFLDSKLANLGYHCADKCQPRIVCENEGYTTQFCRCACPDGFSGDRCELLQGYSVQSKRIPSEKLPSEPVTKPKLTTRNTTTATATTTKRATTTTTTTSIPETVRWLEWSAWSNCSVSCGAGIHVRTRLCSDTVINGSAEPCSALGGSSFEIESCQDAKCQQAEVILSCTFDLADEKCPAQSKDHRQIQRGTQADQFRLPSDHTRGDGNYFIFHGDSNETQTWRIGRFSRLNQSADENHCLEFWYSKIGTGLASLTVIRDDENSTDQIQFDSNTQGRYWQRVQRTVSSRDDYQLEFGYRSSHSTNEYFALDDISLTSGTCAPRAAETRRNRKRRQTDSSCSSVFDLTSTNNLVTISSPGYPNIYPANSRCYYYIRVPANNRLILQFTDFNLPSSSLSYCDDSVEIRYYHLGQPGPTFCGSGANTNNLRFVSSKNYILVVFRSNQYYSGRGFSAQAALAQ